ncbi:MAG: hypothetical protein J6L92_03450, partial [Clostridia bacterium]|nr:hypothetical protein [Clostridia bacterium]
GTLLPYDAFVRVTDEHALARLPESSRDKVRVCDLKALGIDDYGTIGRHGTMLVVNGDKYDYARYPNECDEVARLPMKDAIVFAGDGEKPWELGISDEKCLGWKWTDDIWVYGSFFYEWTHLYMKLSEINKQTKTMKGDVNDPEYRSIAYQHEFSHYFVNVLEELDVPGEWHLDRENGKLYVYPKNGGFNTSDEIRFVVPNVECRSDVIVVDGAENVIINGLDVGRTNGAPVIVKNSKQVLLQRCRFTSYSKEIDIGVGCKKCGMIASRCEYFAETAAVVGGGNRPQLEPGNNFLQNNILFNSKVASGMASRNGVGNVVSHNYLYNTRFSDGQNNECIMEYNIVEGGDTETSDSGMIYVGYGGCSTGGNHYRYNYFFDFAKLDYGIYFDDMARGMYAYGNIVVGNGVNPCHEDKNGKWWPSGGRTYNVHNGGENVFYNNISIDAGYFAFGGDITYWLFDANWNSLFGTIYESSLDKRNEKFMGRNPTYREYVHALDQYKEDKKDPNYVIKSGWAERRLRTPWCNHYENNLIVRADKPYKLDHGIETATGLETNYITNEDPGFVDEKNKNYALKPDSIVFEKIPGFVAPPFEKMGLVNDED